MSKQFKYKLKKTLKQAEFVHADLEYHEELIGDAKRLFHEEVSRWFTALPADVREKLEHFQLLRRQEREEAAQEPPLSVTEEPITSDCTDLVRAEADSEEEENNSDIPESDDQKRNVKKSEIKKLFRKIAELTHPDKTAHAELSPTERSASEKLFMRARKAMSTENWFILYEIALQLGIEIDEGSELHLEWVEADIKETLQKIKDLTNLTAWHWHIGDDAAKIAAIKFYFLKVFNFEYPA